MGRALSGSAQKKKQAQKEARNMASKNNPNPAPKGSKDPVDEAMAQLEREKAAAQQGDGTEYEEGQDQGFNPDNPGAQYFDPSNHPEHQEQLQQQFEQQPPELANLPRPRTPNAGVFPPAPINLGNPALKARLEEQAKRPTPQAVEQVLGRHYGQRSAQHVGQNLRRDSYGNVMGTHPVTGLTNPGLPVPMHLSDGTKTFTPVQAVASQVPPPAYPYQPARSRSILATPHDDGADGNMRIQDGLGNTLDIIPEMADDVEDWLGDREIAAFKVDGRSGNVTITTRQDGQKRTFSIPPQAQQQGPRRRYSH